jgi:excisionase family DNA binding protein
VTPAQISQRLAETATYVDPDTVAAVLEIAHAEYWTVAEVAGLTRVSTRTIRRACQEGRVPALKIRGQWRVAVGPGQLRLL